MTQRPGAPVIKPVTLKDLVGMGLALVGAALFFALPALFNGPDEWGEDVRVVNNLHRTVVIRQVDGDEYDKLPSGAVVTLMAMIVTGAKSLDPGEGDQQYYAVDASGHLLGCVPMAFLGKPERRTLTLTSVFGPCFVQPPTVTNSG